MQSITINTILRTDRQKNGLFPITVRIIVDRKKIEIKVPHYIRVEDLQPNGSVKKSVFNSWSINQDIQNTLNEVNQVILFHRANNINLTPKSFNNLYRKKVDTSTLHTYVKSQAKQMNICTRRRDSYNCLATHLQKDFPTTTLADCDYNFLLKLERYFVQDLKFVQNTVSANMAKLKAILNCAEKQKLIFDNPFNHYKIKGFTSNRQFLSKEEVMQIEKYFNEEQNKTQKNIAAIFLFLCYTGLRVGDFKRLKIENIKDGGIYFMQSKTQRQNFVPLSTPALRFVGNDDFNFYIISAQKINTGLKIIKEKTGITKPLTCHVARHTFATLSMQLDMNIQSISKILGHTKIATTMIYAKVLDETKKQEIAKWNNFLGF